MKPRLLRRLRQRWEHFLSLYTTLGKTIRWLIRILLVLLFVDIGYLVGVWPNWDDFASGDIPKSRFIQAYERTADEDTSLPSLRWRPVPLSQISGAMVRAALVAEDARFFEHGGIDTEAFQKAMEYNWERKQIVYGGSTISQQTVKNLFLSGSRNPLRKFHELMLTIAMEHNLDKKRILEIYLNIAEFGTGIYGIEAAARHYFGVPASQLTLNQAVELAATLPSPQKSNPQTRNSFFMKQRAKIYHNLGM